MNSDTERNEAEDSERHEAGGSLRGLRVAAFESRRAEEMARLIERRGGEPHVSPSLREAPLAKNPEAVEFAHRLITGQVDVVLFLTGVGFRHLLAAVEKHVDRERYLNALRDITTVARGPKPVAAMKEVGLHPTVRVPEPNTWRDILTTLDEQVRLAEQQVAIQEYGLPNPSLVAGLEARGAKVVSVKVYNWELPEDAAPLEANIRALAAGERDLALFTSAHQVVNLLRVAESLGLRDELTRALRERVAVASIGPTTSEMLREQGLPVDIEPEHGKMGHLVAAAAARADSVLRGKPRPPRITVQDSSMSPAGPSRREAPSSEPLPPWHDSPFLRACRREPTPYTPVWLMRQAGRYMPEYQAVRGETPFLDLCRNPELCRDVMLVAVEKLGVDAAIVFSDLPLLLGPLGFELEYTPGPVIHNPLRAADEVDRVREFEHPEELGYVYEAVRLTREALDPRLPLIGFAGSPFTLASYAIEGGSSRTYEHTKRLMYTDEGAWRELMGKLVRGITRYLTRQAEAGAQCLQLFDSWAGCLGPGDYRRYCLPYVRAIIESLPPGVPVINFATGNPALLPLLAEAGGEVIGIDWRIDLAEAWRRVGHDRAVQGNLDPLVLLAEERLIRERVAEVLAQAEGRPGHIFNLGHGVVKETPVENAAALVRAVHELSGRG